MIGSLIRLLGLGGTTRAASAPRFAPQLEVLDGRTMPSVVAVVDGAGGLAGGVFASDATSGVVDNGGESAYSPQDQISLNGTRRSGEEVPAAHGVSPQESISVNGTRRSGEEVPALLTKATPILFKAHIGEEIPQ